VPKDEVYAQYATTIFFFKLVNGIIGHHGLEISIFFEKSTKIQKIHFLQTICVELSK
jgi:hypothetical protein